MVLFGDQANVLSIGVQRNTQCDWQLGNGAVIGPANPGPRPVKHPVEPNCEAQPLEDGELLNTEGLQVHRLAIEQVQVVGETARILDSDPLAGANERPSPFDCKCRVDVPAAG